jgi:hypothetical protein
MPRLRLCACSRVGDCVSFVLGSGAIHHYHHHQTRHPHKPRTHPLTQFQAPVLAKRKTPMMREMEREKRERRQEREAAEKRRAALNHQLYTPGHTDVERERLLRRIATRGGEFRIVWSVGVCVCVCVMGCG